MKKLSFLLSIIVLAILLKPWFSPCYLFAEQPILKTKDGTTYYYVSSTILQLNMRKYYRKTVYCEDIFIKLINREEENSLFPILTDLTRIEFKNLKKSYISKKNYKVLNILSSIGDKTRLRICGHVEGIAGYVSRTRHSTHADDVFIIDRIIIVKEQD